MMFSLTHWLVNKMFLTIPPVSVPVLLLPPVGVFCHRNSGQACSKIVDNVMTSVGRAQSLAGYEDDVDKVTDEEKAKGGEFEKSNSRITEVEAVNAEHAQEHGQEESGVKVVAVGPVAVLVPGEG